MKKPSINNFEYNFSIDVDGWISQNIVNDTATNQPQLDDDLKVKSALRNEATSFLIKQSPNYDARPDINDISLLVIHNISLPPGKFGDNYVIDFFQNNLDYKSHEWFENIRDLKVSAHFFIRRCGQIVQFVSTLDRAWHAGLSCFNGRDKCNDFSIGVELEGTDTLAYEDSQYNSLISLTQAIKQRHNITDICGHEHIAPGRKTDPGPAFDWSRLL